MGGADKPWGYGAFGSPHPVNAHPAPRVRASNDDSATSSGSTEGDSSENSSSEGEGAGLTVNSADEGPKVESAAPGQDAVSWVEPPPGSEDVKTLEQKVEDMEKQIASVDEKVEKAKADADAEAAAPVDDGPLDLADLQSKRINYAAEGLGLEGLIDIFAEE